MKKAIKTFSVFLIITLLCTLFSSCSSNKNAEKVIQCLDANECSTALEILATMDEKEIENNKIRINEKMVIILNKELESVNENISNIDLYLINPQIIERFITYNDILNYLDLDETTTNTKTFAKTIALLNQYVKYNDVAVAICKTSELMDSFNRNMDSAQTMMVYWEPKDNTYFLDAISDCKQSRDCFSAKSDEYMVLGYNFFDEYYSVLNKIKETGKEQNVNNPYEKDFLEMSNEVSDIIELVSDIVQKLPTKIY